MDVVICIGNLKDFLFYGVMVGYVWCVICVVFSYLVSSLVIKKLEDLKWYSVFYLMCFNELVVWMYYKNGRFIVIKFIFCF